MGFPLLFNRLAARPARGPSRPGFVPEAVDVAIVGAGVVGLSIAWRLARRGLRVAVFDAGAAGAGTSAAASGMLAASAELEPGGTGLLALTLESQDLWPAFRAELEVEAACSIDYRAEGTMVVAVGRDEVGRLRSRHELQRAAGLKTRWLSIADIRDLEPGLKPSLTAGLLCPGDHQVDPQAVMAALRTAFLARGGLLAEGVGIDALEREGDRVAGVLGAGQRCRAETTILATGAAIGEGGLLPAGLRVPVRPLKGQSLALRPRRGPALLHHVVWTAEIHIAPKSDGRLIVGATMEECGFDPAMTAGGAYALLDGARRVLPGVEEMTLEAIWAGFRPTSDDDAPILGATGVPGLAVAGGHHRNGFLLAPVTARAFEDFFLRGAMHGAAARFGLGRFAAAPTAVVVEA